MNGYMNIIIFASGNGSNAENIIKYFIKKKYNINWLTISNNKDAGVIEKATKLGSKIKIISKNELCEENFIHSIIDLNPILIILAGFLLKIPKNFIKNFNNRIINIHPSLLPKYGGKGMYGQFVHQKVIENKEIKSGITIHYVNEKYDEGEIIFQKDIEIKDPKTTKSLANQIHELEMEYFPLTIEKLIS
jgi:phosphoribosylglycinamide formyltransferase-1